jgi:hypothetical protein
MSDAGWIAGATVLALVAMLLGAALAVLRLRALASGDGTGAAAEPATRMPSHSCIHVAVHAGDAAAPDSLISEYAAHIEDHTVTHTARVRDM